jgi:predicted nucleic-acid-binding protein
MIGCDTNVLIRAVLDDDPHEAKIAQHFLEKTSREKKLFISSYAILEMVWVLKVKKRTREEIIESVTDLLDSPGIVLGQREAIESALEMYAKGKADFGDYLILAEGEFHHAQKLATFDKVFCSDNHRAQHPKKYI